MRLGDYVDVLSGYAFKSKQFNTEGKGLQVVRIRDVGKERSETYYEGEYKEDFILNNGDLLIGMDGDFRLAEWKGGKALLNQRVCKITVGSNALYRNYLIRMLPRELKRIEDTTSFATVKHLSVKKINDIDLPLPPLEEQKKIAAILDAADAYRQKTKALINKYDQLTQSLFLDMFGDPVTNPMGWDKQKVKDVATIVRGSSPRPKGDSRFYGSGVPRLMVADLTRDGLYVTPKIDSLTMEGAKKSRLMSRGELVMAVSGRPGLTAILEENCCIHDGFAGFKNIDSHYRTEFLCHYFHHFISQVSKVSAGAIFKNITTNDIRMIDLLKIPLERQDYFLKHHQSILRSKILADASLVKAEELFNSLLQKAFKGELTN